MKRWLRTGCVGVEEETRLCLLNRSRRNYVADSVQVEQSNRSSVQLATLRTKYTHTLPSTCVLARVSGGKRTRRNAKNQADG